MEVYLYNFVKEFGIELKRGCGEWSGCVFIYTRSGRDVVSVSGSFRLFEGCNNW